MAIQGQNIQGKVKQLKPFQQTYLEEILDKFLTNNQVDVIEILKKHNYCKSCNSTDLVKNGYCGNIHRYKCRECSKTQSLTSQTHNNNINNVMSLFADFAEDFNGYSTKYQWNYLKWFRYVRLFKDVDISNVVDKALDDVKSNDRYKNIFGYYNEFVAD